MEIYVGVEKWFFQESFLDHPVYHCASRSIDRQLVHVSYIYYNSIKKMTRIMREIILFKTILEKSSLAFILSRKNCGFVSNWSFIMQKSSIVLERSLCVWYNYRKWGLVRNRLIHNNFTIFREETKSVLAGFHENPLSWANWNLEIDGFFMIGRQKSLNRNQMLSGKPLRNIKTLSKRIPCMLSEFCLFITWGIKMTKESSKCSDRI